jgi:hypothetical protein
MFTKKNLTLFALTASFLSLTFIACEKDKEVKDESPAAQIAASEKLVIPAAVDLPANPSGHIRIATYFATGVQKYKAQLVPGTTPARYEWVFVAPLADLYDATNAKVGTHTAGPTWQLPGGQDSIHAQQFSPARTAPGTVPNTIDWLLLMPKTGKVPTGIFANVAYIQRIATKGGKAPATAPVNAAETIDVPYTAIYRLTKKNP